MTIIKKNYDTLKGLLEEDFLNESSMKLNTLRRNVTQISFEIEK